MSEQSPVNAPSDNSPGSAPRSNGHGNVGASNPRSCVTCRRRKVRCDKQNPCANCVRNKIECVFPGPGRAPRKSRKPADAELLERLRRLEGVVSSLNAQVEEHEQEAAERERQSSVADSSCPDATSCPSSNPNPSKATVAVDNSVEGLENRFGRLVVEKGRSRYINNSFWASLNNEVEDLKTILLEPSDDEDDVRSPDSSHHSSHQGFIFGYSSTNVDMQMLHPPEHQGRSFWEVFKENVDPLIKVLHLPTFDPYIKDRMADISKASKGDECLLFAIYYGAVTSTSPEECIGVWGEDRATLLQRYSFGLEQALARANFLFCDEVIVLQAFIIFLFLLRRNDAARKIWTLVGLLVRIAQTLGIHRDGSHFNLGPFEIEMRRRLWWQVCILDARSSEDHGCDPTIVEAQFDTKMPLNVNDSDLTPGMADFPEERQGFTDMTFCLLRFEVANIFRRILYVPPGPTKCTEFFSNLTITDKEKWISECHQRMEQKYLKNADMSNPLCWVTATVSRLIMSKMWLIVYHPHQRKDGGATLPQEIKDKLFITSLENIEYSLLLESEARTMKWGWLFRTYVQWHAIAFLLSELCVRTKGEAVERAWRALEATASQWWFPLNSTSSAWKNESGALWKPLRKLLTKAKAARDKELALERASNAIRNGQQSYNSPIPQGFEPMDLPVLPTDQPSPETLDSMLRPVAPKLGEVPKIQPSWPESPTASSHSNSVPTFQTQQTTSQATPSQTNGANTVNAPRNGASNSMPQVNGKNQDFTSLMNFGFDNVMLDVMDGMNYDGVRPDENSTMPTNRRQQAPMYPPSPQVPNNAIPSQAANLQSAHGTFGDNVFSDVNLSMSPTLEHGTGSPVLETGSMDGGSMDWATWDDMVSQFAMEGQMLTGQSTNPASQIGFVHWF